MFTISTREGVVMINGLGQALVYSTREKAENALSYMDLGRDDMRVVEAHVQ